MKQVFMALVIAGLGYTSAEAQMICKPAPKHRAAVKHKTTEQTTTTTTTACRLVPFRVCKILPDRRSVSCYSTYDSDYTQTGPATIYGPNDPMPGEIVHFKVRTVVVKGEDRGSYCKRNKENNETICISPGLLVRDENGYYSYGEPVPKKAATVVTAK